MAPTVPRRSRAAHLGVWAVAGLVYFLAVLPFAESTVVNLASFKAGWALLGWLTAEGMLLLYRRADVAGQGLGRATAWVVTTSVLAGATWVGVMAGLSISIQGNTLLFFTPTFFPFVVMNHVFILMAWSGGYLALQFWRRAQADERRSLAAQSEARAAQLALLRLQLNPHFLFNSLASLRALIAEDADAARRMVTRLSAFLRYALASDRGAWTTVAEELDVLKTYLEIERVRFGERLDVSVALDERAAEVTIPGLILLSLVENAVKHGQERGGSLGIAIEAGAQGNTLELRVRNTGHLVDAGNGQGVGLRNVRARLATAYPERASLSLVEDQGTVSAVIRIRDAWRTDA